MKNAHRGFLPLAGLILAAVSVLVTGVIAWVTFRIVKGVVSWVFLTAGFVFAFVLAYYLLVKPLMKGKEMSEWSYAFGIGLPILFIAFGVVLSSAALSWIPGAAYFKMAPAAAQVSALTESTAPAAAAGLDLYAGNLMWLGLLLGSISFFGYYIDNKKVE